jgi:hypothetical protein
VCCCPMNSQRFLRCCLKGAFCSRTRESPKVSGAMRFDCIQRERCKRARPYTTLMVPDPMKNLVKLQMSRSFESCPASLLCANDRPADQMRHLMAVKEILAPERRLAARLFT